MKINSLRGYKDYEKISKIKSQALKIIIYSKT